jgi:glycosyltransferase involved in cell wall biosynthesis
VKIVIVGTAFPLRGGIAHFNALLAAHLRKHHDVETVTFKRQYPAFLFPGKSQDEQGELAGVDAAPQLIDSINPFNWYRVAKEISRRNPDLLIFKYWLPFFGPCFGTIAKIVKKRTNARALFICDNVVPHEHRPGDVAFTKYAFRQGDFFIVQSDTVERDLVKYFPNAVYRNVPHPVYENFGLPVLKDQARAALGLTNRKIILYFGYIRAYKGLMILLDAMKYLDDVELLAVGEFYDDESKYRQKVKDLGLTQRVRFVAEYVPNENVGGYFCASDVVVLPYLSATQSGIIQIAYNFNKPVIATNVGGLAEVIIDGKTGFIVPPNDPAALAESIRKFYVEHREDEFSRNVIEEKKKYSWERFIRTIEDLVAQSSTNHKGFR